MFIAASIGLLIAMVMVGLRAVLGPTAHDRILAVNIFGTMTVLALAVFGFLQGRPEFLDIALTYALINFVALVAVLKFMHYADLGWQQGGEDEGDT